MHRHRSASDSRLVDSMLNYDTAKYFAAEESETARSHVATWSKHDACVHALPSQLRNEGLRRMTLDKTDRAILMAMQGDGRTTNASLAESVGLSETPCARRLKRLEADGYIEGYRAVLSKSALHIGVTAFALVRFGVHDRRLADEFERQIQAIERIVSCHNVSGSADYLLHVVARDLEDYGAFMRDVLRALPGVTSVESVLSLREVKRDAGLPLL